MSINIESILRQNPIYQGRSKTVYRVDEQRCLIRLVPSLTSFTYQRHEMVHGSDVLRLDFYERAVQKLAQAGIKTAFLERVDPTSYLAHWCSNPPFEVIVKNYAVGSTQKNYPGLFPDDHRFKHPVVKFDFRKDPEDFPLAEDYIREFGYDPTEFRRIALAVNRVLQDWLTPRRLIDFCIIFGENPAGEVVITSEISPDGMRLKNQDGASLDKDLFRQGASHETILGIWSSLVGELAPA